MLEHLVVRLPTNPGDVSWVALDSAGQRLAPVASGSLEDAAGAAENRRVLVLVPGLEAVCSQASLPVRSAARLRQMLPYSLEDVVAEDVERLHFAAGPGDVSGATPVTMATRRQMDRWLAEFEQAGLSPERIYCESDGVPAVPGCTTLVVEGDCTYGRAPGQAPFALQGLGLGEILQVALGDGESSEVPHVTLFADIDGYARCESDVAWLREQGVSVDVQLLREGLLPRLGATLIDRPGCNLLQGAYARKSNWQSRFRPWRFAAALLLGVLVLAIAGEGARYIALSREDRSVTAMLETACRVNAQATSLAACEAQIQRRLASTVAGNGAGFLVALEQMAQAWNEDTRLEALSFRTGVIDLRIVAGNVSALDEFAREISSSGTFQASIQSANPTQDGILGRLQIAVNPQ